MSNQERQKVWRELKPGDTLVEIEWNMWGDRYFISKRKVKKRTPKGWIRLDTDELLKDFHPKYHIITDELKEWFKKIELEEDLLTFMNLNIMRNKKKFKENLSYEDAKLLKDIFERTLPSKIKSEE
jgi:hypothetical protein